MNFETKVATCCGIVCCLTVTIVIVVFSSFEYIDYNEYAFKKNTISNTVNTEVVYENGRHFWGLFTTSIVFPRDYQVVTFEGLVVSDAEEKAFRIDVSFWYRLQKDNLANLYQQFGESYEGTILSKAQSTIKNVVPLYTVQEVLDDRQEITAVMNQNLMAEMAEIWIEVEENKFQIELVTLEQSTISKFLDAAILLQENDQKEFEQEAELIRQNTTKFVKEIEAETTLITREAEANYDKTIEIATANAQELTSNARGLGIATVVNGMSFNSTEARTKFIRLVNILDNKSTKVIDVDNTLITV